MTHPGVEVQLTIRLQSGAKKVVWIDPFDASKILPDALFTSGTYPANGLPPDAGAPNGKQHPAPAPDAALGVAQHPAAGPRVGVDFRGLGRPSREPGNTTQEELAALYTARAELARDKTSLAKTLAPVWERRDRLKEQIVVTHNGRFRLAGKGERKPLWGALTEISATWGKQFATYTQLTSRVKQYTREIEKLERAEKKQWQKRKS